MNKKLTEFINKKQKFRKANLIWPFGVSKADIRTRFIDDDYSDKELINDLKQFDYYDTVHGNYYLIKSNE